MLGEDYDKWNVDHLCRSKGNIQKVQRVSALDYREKPDELNALISAQVEEAGLPLVISDLHKLPGWVENSEILTPQAVASEFEQGGFLPP